MAHGWKIGCIMMCFAVLHVFVMNGVDLRWFGCKLECLLQSQHKTQFCTVDTLVGRIDEIKIYFQKELILYIW